MKEFKDKIAVVTGGGSGIGRAASLKFAENGMDIAIADVDIAGGEETAKKVRELGRRAVVIKTDVSERKSVQVLADTVVHELGVPSLIFNNAGVVTFKNVFEMTSADWSWVMGVNLGGVINGVSVFLPLMVDAGKGGHIVNTSSSAGLFGIPGLASYCASKTAVVGLSEHLRGDLEELKIGVSVLCPGGVATNIVDAGRSRPSRFGGPESLNEDAKQTAVGIAQGLGPDVVAEMIMEGVRNNELYIMTHSDIRIPIEARLEALRSAYAVNAKFG